MKFVLFLPFLLLVQSVGIAPDVLFAQTFGSARGPASRSTAPQNPAPQVVQPQVLQPKVATQRRQVDQIAPTPASTSGWNPASDPHPAVVRIIAFDKDKKELIHSYYSFGSGTYIATSGNYGIIITNWHVVRDSEGLVQVHFPNGFASYSAIVSYDHVWDLAVLMISRPDNLPVVPIAKTAPKIGDPLWIAGYGHGTYRLIGGRCTQYVTPGDGQRNEFVELSVEARQGDSGGPIFNQKGELAGVLFGSVNNTTAGSFCGRVQFFLDQSQERIKSTPPEPEKLFASIEPGAPRHKLSKGAELFRAQIVENSLPNQPSSGTVQQYTYSDPRNRGSAHIRETRPPGTPHQTAYPAFPDFSRKTPPQENVSQSTEIHYNTTVLGTPQTNRRQEQPSERIAMSTPPPGPTPLFVESVGIDGVLVSDSALVAASQPGSFFTTLKIIAVIIVVFFVIFHLVKLMSIIEEN